VAVGALAGTATTASAAPARPDGCSFEQGFAAFREALGELLIGNCRANEATDGRGNTYQRTSRGTLGWIASTNQVGYRQSTRLWLDGPAGIGSDVVIDGLSDRSTTREPVRAPASLALQAAALLPDDLGEGWEYSEPPGMPTRKPAGQCGSELELPTFGSLYTVFRHEEDGRQVVHALMAMPDATAQTLKLQMDGWIAACSEMTLRSQGMTFVMRLSLEPMEPLGDEAMIVRGDGEVLETGQVFTTRTAYVRYGGLISAICVQPRADEEPGSDHGRDEVLLVARLAHDRVQDAAWYLRD
jgi:hypothetical protein